MDQKKDRKKIKAEPGAAGHKYTWAWILGLLIIVVALFGLSLYQRYKDIGKNDGYSYVDARVVEVSTQKKYRWYKWRRRTTTTYIKVAYKPEGSDKYYEIGKNDLGPRIINKPYRVYYKADDPKDAYIAICDWLTREYVPADKSYDLPIAIAGYVILIALIYSLVSKREKRSIKKGTLKPGEKAKD